MVHPDVGRGRPARRDVLRGPEWKAGRVAVDPDKAVDLDVAALAATERQGGELPDRVLPGLAVDAAQGGLQDPLSAEPLASRKAVQQSFVPDEFLKDGCLLPDGLPKAGWLLAGQEQDAVERAQPAAADPDLPEDEVAEQSEPPDVRPEVLRKGVLLHAEPPDVEWQVSQRAARAAASDAAVLRQAARAAMAVSVPKEPVRAVDPPMELASKAAEWGVAAWMAQGADPAAELRESSSVPSEDGSAHLSPALVDAAELRAVYCPPRARLLSGRVSGRSSREPAAQWARAVLQPIRMEEQMTRRQRCASAARQPGEPASIPRTVRARQPTSAARARAPPLSVASSRRSQIYRRQNTAAASRRCRRRSSWNGSTPR